MTELELVNRIWTRAYMDTKEEHVKLIREYAKACVEASLNQLRLETIVRKEGYTFKRDGWKPESEQYAAYDLMVRELTSIQEKITDPSNIIIL